MKIAVAQLNPTIGHLQVIRKNCTMYTEAGKTWLSFLNLLLPVTLPVCSFYDAFLEQAKDHS